jgi:hypothetical protein
MCASRAFEYVLLIVAACPPIGTAAQTDVARIPHAPAFVTLNIAIHPGWNVEFRCNHDGQELTCIISQLKHGEEEQYPELLFDPRNLKSTKWQTGQWWLHSSYNLCEGNGKFNVYTRNGTFQCAKRKHGWRSNHFPLRTMDVMTIQVALSKIGLAPGRQFGFAADVTDTKSEWHLWPTGASLRSPATWATAELVQR